MKRQLSLLHSLIVSFSFHLILFSITCISNGIAHILYSWISDGNWKQFTNIICSADVILFHLLKFTGFFNSISKQFPVNTTKEKLCVQWQSIEHKYNFVESYYFDIIASKGTYKSLTPSYCNLYQTHMMILIVVCYTLSYNKSLLCLMLCTSIYLSMRAHNVKCILYTRRMDIPTRINIHKMWLFFPSIPKYKKEDITTKTKRRKYHSWAIDWFIDRTFYILIIFWEK